MSSSARCFQNQQLSQRCVSINLEIAHTETVKTKTPDGTPDVSFVQTPIYRNRVLSTHMRQYFRQFEKCIFLKNCNGKKVFT